MVFDIMFGQIEVNRASVGAGHGALGDNAGAHQQTENQEADQSVNKNQTQKDGVNCHL